MATPIRQSRARGDVYRARAAALCDRHDAGTALRPGGERAGDGDSLRRLRRGDAETDSDTASRHDGLDCRPARRRNRRQLVPADRRAIAIVCRLASGWGVSVSPKSCRASSGNLDTDAMPGVVEITLGVPITALEHRMSTRVGGSHCQFIATGWKIEFCGPQLPGKWPRLPLQASVDP